MSLCRILIVVVAVVAVNAHRHQQAHLRTSRQGPADKPVVDENSKVRNVFTALDKDMGDLYFFQDNEVKSDGGGAGQNFQMPQGMQIPLQEPDDHIKPLMEKLDKKCGDRFQATLHGKAQGMHTLDLGSEALKEECEAERDGKLCDTKATILTTQKDTSTSNDVEARFTMDGRSCIPKECVSSKNLAALSEFMRERATTMGKEMGNDLDIALAVDCAAHPEGGVVHSPPKSAAAVSASVAMPALLVLLAARLF